MNLYEWDFWEKTLRKHRTEPVKIAIFVWTMKMVIFEWNCENKCSLLTCQFFSLVYYHQKKSRRIFYLKHRRIQNKKEDFEYWFQWILISNRWFLAKLWTTLEISRNVWKFVLWNIENNGIMIERSFNGSRRLWHEQKKWSQTDGHFKVIWVRQIILRT